ncbi:hypothetical protein [Entomomonas asaccharolytica]|uniref:Uncharacterized protein n=1 Tax=Entomomonas asaccharolytica TaxID=2785331 RepID=A0A974NI51_9GAMM|nr:hypothetical protein [Entomomonas asaccharolytica]QQP86919.1 hypothetical protein JHT90_06655 [Entomomonas asaccharolytica]
MSDSLAYFTPMVVLTFLSIALVIFSIGDAVDIKYLKREVAEIKQQLKQIELKREVAELKAENHKLKELAKDGDK